MLKTVTWHRSNATEPLIQVTPIENDPKKRRAVDGMSHSQILSWPSAVPAPHHPGPPSAADLLAAIVESSDDAIVSKTLDGVITSWNGAAERLFGYSAREAIGRHISLIAAPGREAEMSRILARLREGERIGHYETLRRHKDGSLVEVSLTISPIRDARGTIIGASKIARSVSERRLWEKQQARLLRELSHRVKNTLAIIQSVARQTGRRAASVDEFLTKFEARLAAMAAAHDHLVLAEWKGVALADIVRNTLRSSAKREDGRIRFATLPTVWLEPSLALNLALVLHELASNARAHGALSRAEGRVDLQGDRHDDTFWLIWRETGGPPVPKPPAQQGFGMRLLAGAIAHQHGGHVHFDWRREGLVCTMLLPITPPVPSSLW